MKKLIVIILLLSSCQEDDIEPAPIDPFVGSWDYSNATLPLDLSFDVTQKSGVFSFKNIIVDYPEVSEIYTYNIELHGKTATGYSLIKIIGGNDTSWIIISLMNTTIRKEGNDYLMDVEDMALHMINRDPVELENQVFIRID